jgi:hypothetical protein
VFLLFKLIKPLVLALVLVAVYLLAPALSSPSGTALHARVLTEVGGAPVGPTACTRRGTVTWRCPVFAEGGSDPATYSVRVDGRCFTARRTARGAGDGAPLAARASGCVKLRDQLPGGHALAGIG